MQPAPPCKEAVEWAEDVLARAGYAIVSHETEERIERIERSITTASFDDLSRVLYAVHSGPYGVYWPAKEFA